MKTWITLRNGQAHLSKQTMFAVVCFAGLAAFAPKASAEVIYSDSFTGSSANGINGTSPSISSGTLGGSASAAWSANDSVFRANGSINGNVGFVFPAYLPFTPQSGVIYTISADVNTTSGNSGDWIALSLFKPSVTYDPIYAVETRMLLRNANERGSGGGQTSTNGTDYISYYAASGTVNLQIVLDTTSPQWTEQFFQNGVSVYGPFVYSTNPTIGYVGFEQLISASGTIDNFVVTATAAVPEPSSIALAGLGGLGLAFAWYRNRKFSSQKGGS